MTQRRIIQNEYPYFATFRTKEGFELFKEEKYAALMARVIVKTGEMKGYDVLASQIMPDHVHLLVYNHRARVSPPALQIHMDSRATAERCARGNNYHFRSSHHARGGHTISEFMYTVKSYFVHQMRMQYGIDFLFFQKRFYARIVDTDEYLRTVIEYIRYNPVKAELPGRYQRVPYQYFDRNEHS